MPGKPLSTLVAPAVYAAGVLFVPWACRTSQYPVNPVNSSGTLLTSAVQVIIELKAIEVPYRPPTAEEEKSA
jgi:hypothetical protein